MGRFRCQQVKIVCTIGIGSSHLYVDVWRVSQTIFAREHLNVERLRLCLLCSDYRSNNHWHFWETNCGRYTYNLGILINFNARNSYFSVIGFLDGVLTTFAVVFLALVHSGRTVIW